MFLNLSLGQFLAAFAAASAVAVALYLLERSRRKQIVPTLRFWVLPGLPSPVTRRYRIQQPWSLLMQLLAMLLLLLAVAGFQWGGAFSGSRDHVLIIDTSSWMAAAAPGRSGATLIDLARANAISWLRAVPSSDRVMLLRADALATPATGWETNHSVVARAILESKPGATALSLAQSLEFARKIQLQSGSRPGEIVYDGPGRLPAREAGEALPQLPQFRFLPVADPHDNLGLRRVGARHSDTAQNSWDVLVTAHNYDTAARQATITLNFGHAPVGNHVIAIPPGTDKETTFTVHSEAAGIVEARIYPRDAFLEDNYAALELPEQRGLHVVVYSDQPQLLRPALEAAPRLRAEFRATTQYLPENDGLVILDHFHPATLPQGDSLWLDPPSGGPQDHSPFTIREHTAKPSGLRWTPDEPLAAGLSERDMDLASASVFATIPGDISVAAVDRGPIVVARTSGKSRMVALGFNPFSGRQRFELATPLLLVNILRWFSPETFRDVDVAAGAAGSVNSAFPFNLGDKKVQVLNDDGENLPFSIRDRTLQFFAGQPSRVQVIVDNAERVYSLTLPEMWDTKWTVPPGTLRGIPAWSDSLRRSVDLWPWLALLGVLFLLSDWILYGRESTARLHIVASREGVVS